MPQPQHILYPHITFPDYEFREFPKYVNKPGTDPVERILVNDEEEEALALGGKDVVREEDAKEILLRQAKAQQLMVDKRWGVDKLRKAIIDAQIEPEA